MTPLDVVEVVEIVADGAHRGFARRAELVVNELGAQGSEEATALPFRLMLWTAPQARSAAR